MGLETATKEIILVASLGVGIGGMLINSNHADENALNTCNAISQGTNPEDNFPLCQNLNINVPFL